jgi:succinate dehydrogenase / fumarate reductase membrane anchor subunit
MVNRFVTGAHYGLRDWLAQRITATVMTIYIVTISGYLLLQPSFGYDTWAELTAATANIRKLSLYI